MTELEELRLAYAECSRQRFELLAKLKNSQLETEPVAWIINGDLEEVKRYGRRALVLHSKPVTNGIETPLYTYPPKREWQGLTDEEMHACWDSPLTPLGMKHARMIEAKLKEKNT